MRGFMSLRTVVLLVLAGALGIAVVAYGQMALAYYRIKQEAIKLGNEGIISPESESAAIDRFLSEVKNRTELTLQRSDVVVKRYRDVPDEVTIEVHVVFPVHFLVVNRTRYEPKVITIQAKRLKAY
jgi:hypothetical protein